MMRERFEELGDLAREIATAPYRAFTDFKSDILEHLSSRLIKDPSPEEARLIDFAADLLRDTLKDLGALHDEDVRERAARMSSRMVEISQVEGLGIGASGQHSKTLELIRLSETKNVHEQLAVVIHEFIHHLFIQIRKGRQWMGVDEGLVEGFTQYVLKKNAGRIFKKYPHELPYDKDVSKKKRLEVFWELHTKYTEQVEIMNDVIAVLATHEGITIQRAQEDFYRTFLGLMSFRDMAKRVERACGKGALRLLRAMASAHQGMNISHDAAKRSIPEAIIAPHSHEVKIPPHSSILNYEEFDRDALPNSGVPLTEQYKYMRRRFFIDAERLLQEGPPYEKTEYAVLVRALKNLQLWRKMHLEKPEGILFNPHKYTAEYREERKEFRKRYDKHTRAFVSRIRAALRDSTRLTREG